MATRTSGVRRALPVARVLWAPILILLAFLVAPPDFEAPGGEVRRLDQPLSGGEDGGDLLYSGPIQFYSTQPDGDRVWFGNDHGIYLYTAGAGLQKVFGFNAPNQGDVFPAGLCV